MRALIIGLMLTSAASAQSVPQTFDEFAFSEHDLWLLGAGLDQLPPNMTRELQQRMQVHINQKIQAFAKAKADADKAAFDKAVAEAVAKVQTDKPETPQ